MHRIAKETWRVCSRIWARRLFEEVIEGQMAQLGASHSSTLTSKGNLLHGYEAAHGANDPRTAEVQEWLGELA